MTNPKLRIEVASTDFERELLGSWEHEGPSVAARQRALGLGASVIGGAAVVGVTKASAAATSLGTSFSSGGAAKASGVWLLGKWAMAGMLCATAVVGGGTIGVRTLRHTDEGVTTAVVSPMNVDRPPSAETRAPAQTSSDDGTIRAPKSIEGAPASTGEIPLVASQSPAIVVSPETSMSRARTLSIILNGGKF